MVLDNLKQKDQKQNIKHQKHILWYWQKIELTVDAGQERVAAKLAHPN